MMVDGVSEVLRTPDVGDRADVDHGSGGRDRLHYWE
jgi:hypothetical protein